MSRLANEMDHSEAVRLQAAEKYVLGELTRELRDEYEEHYFECGECALDVKAAAMVLDGMRQIAVGERTVAGASGRAVAVSSPSREQTSGGWFDRAFGWLRPAIAVPVFAALLAAVIYESAVVIPALKPGSRAAGTAQVSQVYGSSYSLIGANVRGGSAVEITVRPSEGFLLDFDFTPSASFESYRAELQDSSGRVLLRSSIPGSDANKSLHFAVPAETLGKAGQYALVFTGGNVSASEGKSGTEVQRLVFDVAFRD